MAAEDNLGAQFGGQNTHDPQGSSYSPAHSNWSMAGSTGRHAKSGRSGRSGDKGFYNPQHAQSSGATPGYQGRHTTAGVMMRARGALKSLHKAVTGY